jgi:putative spermidine/putrescine transport system substrate-binding protein
MNCLLERRSFLKLAVTAGAVITAPAVVRSQSKRFEGVTLRINAYGGDYTRLLQTRVARPLEERTGLKVIYQSGTVAAAVAMLIASRDNPPFDVMMLDSPNVPDLMRAQLIEPVTVADVPNIKRLLPGVREFGDNGVPFLTNSIILTNNTKRVKTPIASFRDLGRADLEGRVGLLSPENTGGVLTLVALAEMNGGSIDNMDPAFAFLEKSRKNIAAVTPATVNLLQLLEQEEVWAAPFFDGRIYSMRAKGLPMPSIVPQEGIYSIFNYLAPVKGSKHRDAIMVYLEQTLSDESVAPFVEFFRYGPVTDVKLSDDVTKDVVLSGATRERIKQLDWSKVSQLRGQWAERFNRTMR